MSITLRTLRSGSASGYLLVHGFLGSSRDWQEIVRMSAGAREILALDLPGHGESSAPVGATSFEGVIEVLGRGLQERLMGPVHGVGYSLGGRIVVGLSQRYPDLFSSLTLISTFPGYEDEHERAARLASDVDWAQRFKKNSLPEVLRDWYRQPIFASEEWTADLWSSIVSRCVDVRQESVAEMLLATSSAKMPSYWKHLEKTHHPLQLIVGERDKKYVGIAREVARRNPGSEVAVVAEAGHSVLLEKPFELAKRLCFQ